MLKGKINFAVLIIGITLFFSTNNSFAQEYVLLGWNDLGMHCSNQEFSKVVVLPPFNNVTAQLILKNPNQIPQVVSSGYTIEYSVPGNTYSVGKTNFWDYAQQLFGLANPLPPNIGLTGKGMTGELDSAGNFFIAHGIPITPFQDNDLIHESPFQLVHLVARSKTTGNVLASTDAVIPVSNEVGCVQSGCHTSAQNILDEHEDVSNFNRNGPVLCASCHASNALGTTGIPEAKSFSYRMHNEHKTSAGPKNDIATCYKCHPGPNTECLRDIMGKNPTNPMICQDCHGTMDTVAATISSGRRPWFDEPKCGTCHGQNYAEETGKLYRMSKGHGGLYCSACHGSPHAIQPTVEANDNIQNIRLQGYAGVLGKCSVCHTSPMAGAGPHGLMDTTSFVSNTPTLSAPLNNSIGITQSPLLQWNEAQYALTYEIQLSKDAEFATLILDDSLLSQTSLQIISLDSLQTYYWRVRSRNLNGYSEWSGVWSFTTTYGIMITNNVQSNWNLLSLPLVVQNPQVVVQFPMAISHAFSFSSLSGYTTQDTMETGSGYWLKFANAGSIYQTGERITSRIISVQQGWNLVGSISVSVPIGTITSNPGGIVTSEFFGYSNTYYTVNSIEPGKAHWVKVNQAGTLTLSTGAAIASNKITIIPTDELPPQPPGELFNSDLIIPNTFILEQNYPNPFNPITTINYQIPDRGTQHAISVQRDDYSQTDVLVTLKVYNMVGEEVATLVNEIQSPGYKTVRWDGSKMSSGIYTYRLTAGDVSMVKKMLLLK